MSNEEKAELNYLLTKLRCQIQDFIVESGADIPPTTELEWDLMIDKINDIMKFSIIEGGDNND